MKKFTSVLLTIIMLFCISTSVFAEDMTQKQYPQKFYDVSKDHWAFEYIAKLADRGVIDGYSDGSFKPEKTVTRAEWAKIMVVAAGIKTTDDSVYFNDTYNHWAILYINASKNYLTAYADGSYRPDQAAVREDVAAAMVKLKGYDISEADYSYLNQFTDTNTISNNLKKYVAVAVQNGLIDGFDDKSFKGQDTLTRAQAAKLLYLAFEHGSDNKLADLPTEKNEDIVNPIKAPTEKPAPKQTQAPEAPEITEKPVSEPAEEPKDTPELTSKPYKVETLAKTNADIITYDNNGTIYYNDYKIYSLSADGTKKEVFNPDTMIMGEDFSAEPFQVNSMCCDNSGNLYINTTREDNRLPETYIVNNGTAELYKDSINYKIYKQKALSSPIFISDENVVITCQYQYENLGYIGRFGSKDLLFIQDRPICASEYDNNLIIAATDSIYEYDYNKLEKLSNSYGTAGLSNNGYVIEQKGAFIIHSFNDTEEIRFSFDDCDIKDKTSLNPQNIYEAMFLMPDNSIVFYDTSAKAFRIISRNN